MDTFTNKDSTNKDSTNNDSTNKDSTNNDSTNKDSINKDSANKDSANKDSANKDSANKDTIVPNEEYKIVPLNRDTLQDSKFADSITVIGHLFTGSSVVPYYYPSFRCGFLASSTNNDGLYVQEHVQYYAPLETSEINAGTQVVDVRGETRPPPGLLNAGTQVVDVRGETLFPGYKESCSTLNMGLASLIPTEWSAFLKRTSSSSNSRRNSTSSDNQLDYYWDCSTGIVLFGVFILCIVHYPPSSLHESVNGTNNSSVYNMGYMIVCLFFIGLFLFYSRSFTRLNGRRQVVKI